MNTSEYNVVQLNNTANYNLDNKHNWIYNEAINLTISV